MKNCIACAEDIKLEALLCRWCSTRQDDASFNVISHTPQTDESSEKSIPKTTSVTARSFDPGRWPKDEDEQAQGLGQQVQPPSPSEHLKPLRWPEEEKDSGSSESGLVPFATPRKLTKTPGFQGGEATSQFVTGLFTIGCIAAAVIGTLAYLYNPNIQRSVDGWLTNVFSDTGSYFDAGYSDAKNNNAEKNSSIGYANAYCSLITSVQNLPSDLARQEYLRGCVSYVTSP